MNNDIRDIILKYGGDIIRSEEFRATFEQKHHMDTTVGDHTLGVAAEAVYICLLCSQTDDRTLENVVVSSLCHDLGIIGRDEKFDNNAQCLMRHPVDSAEVYRNLTGEKNERVLDSILSHMFPLKPRMPKHREGWILTLADKTASAREKLGRPSVSRAEREEILALAGGRPGQG